MNLRPFLFVALLACSDAYAFDYPASARGPVVEDYHGSSVADPYRWLEDLDAPQTRDWVQAQNALTLPFLAALPEREEFRARLTQLWNYERYDVPEQAAGRIFYTRNDGLQNQAVLYVQDRDGAAPRLLLDPNTLSADGTVALTQREVSPNGEWMVYGTAAAGSDWNEFRIRNVASGADQPEVLSRIKFSGASWTRDNQGFFYSRYPDAPAGNAVFDELANQKIWYHRLGTPQSQDVLVYELPQQPKWFVEGEVSDDGRYLFISLRTGSGNENALYYQPLGDPAAPKLDAPVRKLIDRYDAQFSVIGNEGAVVYLLTDRDAPRRRVIAIDLRAPQPQNWLTVVPQSADTLDSAELANGQLVLLTLHDATSKLLRYSLDGRRLQDIALPGLGSISALSSAAGDRDLYFGYSSFNTPLTNYRLDLRGGKPEVFQPLKLSFDPADYVTEQVFYTSKDSTRVPMFVSYRKGLKRDGSAHAYLHGYGGFDISKMPTFDASALAWMERGGVYAVANLRGGGEYGKAWHEAGIKQRKQNVFDDFVGAAGYLIDQGYTSSKHLSIWGRSNGGLLVGASVNQHPGLWSAAVATVGVMDMLRFHKFTVGYAWTGDYGSSDDADGFRYLSAYSPLHTVRPGTRYPATLVMTGDHDDRVHPAHSYKYAAELQRAQAGEAPVLIRIDTNAGHGSGKPVAKVIEEEADKLAFMWHYTGDTQP